MFDQRELLLRQQVHTFEVHVEQGVEFVLSCLGKGM
jgi:hypothetical protein